MLLKSFWQKIGINNSRWGKPHLFSLDGSSAGVDEPNLVSFGILHKNSIKSLYKIPIDIFLKVCYNNSIVNEWLVKLETKPCRVCKEVKPKVKKIF